MSITAAARETGAPTENASTENGELGTSTSWSTAEGISSVAAGVTATAWGCAATLWAIGGGSAGGYTTLCALTSRNSFTAGASHYGVSDLEALAKDTHKFESRYLDRLIGPYPERRNLYLERSPIHFTERLN